jgi:hypothetical protein
VTAPMRAVELFRWLSAKGWDGLTMVMWAFVPNSCTDICRNSKAALLFSSAAYIPAFYAV